MRALCKLNHRPPKAYYHIKLYMPFEPNPQGPKMTQHSLHILKVAHLPSMPCGIVCCGITRGSYDVRVGLPDGINSTYIKLCSRCYKQHSRPGFTTRFIEPYGFLVVPATPVGPGVPATPATPAAPAAPAAPAKPKKRKAGDDKVTDIKVKKAKKTRVTINIDDSTDDSTHEDTDGDDENYCRICYDTKCGIRGWVDCGAGHKFGKPCLALYAEGLADNGAVDFICPSMYNCDQKINVAQLDLKKAVEKKIAQNNLKESGILTKTCFSCGAINAVTVNELADDYVVCPICHARQCTRCDQRSHLGACVQERKAQDASAEDDIKALEAAGIKVTKCKTCGNGLTKAGNGCNVVKCPTCDAHVCFDCGTYILQVGTLAQKHDNFQLAHKLHFQEPDVDCKLWP